MDCKADRKASVLHIHALVLESSLRKTDAFARALTKELVSFLQFNECNSLRLHNISPAGFKPELEKAMKNLL